MAVIGTFGSFTTARLGIYASQASLQVTGNNIANINTNGYTRQRADLVSLNSTGTAKYANPMGVDIGYGVLVKSTTQLRDPYLDIRYRNENTKLGESTATLNGLNKIAQTLDEVNKGGVSQNGMIEDALQLFESALQNRDTTMGAEEYDSLVREAAKSLITFFNTASDKLQTDWDNQADELKETVKEVNACLTNIRELNEQIRKQGLYGDLALELRDARNLEIDKLSGFMGINVEYSMERIDQYTEVEKLTITLKDTKDPNNDNQPVKLIDGLYAGQLTIPDSFPTDNPDYEEPPERSDFATDAEYEAALTAYQNDPQKSTKYIKADANGNPNGLTNDPDEAVQIPNDKFLPQIERLVDKKGRVCRDEDTFKESVLVLLSDTDLTGSVQAMRELLTEEGEFASKADIGVIDGANLTDQVKELLERAADPNANIKKGIPYYQKRLDSLARKFAEVFNEANQMPASTVYKTSGTADNDRFIDQNNNPILDAEGNPITLDMVTVEVPVLDSDGNQVFDENNQPMTKRVPLDSPEADPKPTQEQIVKAAECLEILRDQGVKAEGYEYYDGGVLFSNGGNNNDPTGITAGNISISNAWASRVVHTLRTKQPDEPGIEHSSRSDNIDHMISMFEKQLDYTASDIEPDASGGKKSYFHGSFQEMYTDIGATLGGEQSTMMGIVYNDEIMTLNMDNNRISISGVDLNDEATGMMQFQRSYQAACRLLTTIDSMLDTLINGTLR